MPTALVELQVMILEHVPRELQQLPEHRRNVLENLVAPFNKTLENRMIICGAEE